MDWGAGNVPYFDLRIAEKAIRTHRTIFLCVCVGGVHGILLPLPGFEPAPAALEWWYLNPWATSKVLSCILEREHVSHSVMSNSL